MDQQFSSFCPVAPFTLKIYFEIYIKIYVNLQENF